VIGRVDDKTARAKRRLTEFLDDGEVAVMFVWDENDEASYIGPKMDTQRMVKLLREAAKAFEVDGKPEGTTLQ